MRKYAEAEKTKALFVEHAYREVKGSIDRYVGIVGRYMALQKSFFLFVYVWVEVPAGVVHLWSRETLLPKVTTFVSRRHDVTTFHTEISLEAQADKLEAREHNQWKDGEMEMEPWRHETNHRITESHQKIIHNHLF